MNDVLLFSDLNNEMINFVRNYTMDKYISSDKIPYLGENNARIITHIISIPFCVR